MRMGLKRLAALVPKCGPKFGPSNLPRRYIFIAWRREVFHFARTSASCSALTERPNIIAAPTIADALPPSSNQKVLSVGAPVKAHDTSEFTESDASKP